MVEVIMLRAPEPGEPACKRCCFRAPTIRGADRELCDPCEAIIRGKLEDLLARPDTYRLPAADG